MAANAEQLAVPDFAPIQNSFGLQAYGVASERRIAGARGWGVAGDWPRWWGEGECGEEEYWKLT